jgi:hypothetical protein
LGRAGKESRAQPRQDEKGVRKMSTTWSDIFKIFIGNDGSYNLYLEEQEACVNLIENISDEIEISDFAEMKAASSANLRDDKATLRLDNIRKNLPPMALKVAKLSERELLDLAQEIIQVVQDKNRVRLEIVK